MDVVASAAYALGHRTSSSSHNPDYGDVKIENPEFLQIIGIVTWVLADKRKFN